MPCGAYIRGPRAVRVHARAREYSMRAEILPQEVTEYRHFRVNATFTVPHLPQDRGLENLTGRVKLAAPDDTLK